MDSMRAAEILVRHGAVAFRVDPPFQFTSGTISPVYIDNRILLSFVDARRELITGLADTVSEVKKIQPVEAIAGTATAGIPWAAWLAEVLNLPLLYVRSEAKEWGHEKNVEGVAPEGSHVLVIEDLLYSGGSASNSVRNLRAAGLKVQACLCIVSYDTPAIRRLEADGVMVCALTNVDEALSVAELHGLLSADERTRVSNWLDGIRAVASPVQEGPTRTLLSLALASVPAASK